MAIIDQLHQKHYKAKYLGWVDSGVNLHIYFNNPPKFKADGMPDFAGVKLRDVWAQKDLGTFESRHVVDVPPHGTALLVARGEGLARTDP